MARTANGLQGVYSASLPTLSDGDGSSLQVDSSGRVLVNVAVGGATTSNGTYNTVLPTIMNGATNSIQLDVNGRTLVVATQPTGTNLHVVTDSTSTTIATQATGTNLHVVTDSTSTTAVTQATASNLNAQVIGNVASLATDSGFPVKGASVFNSSPVTATNGQRVDLQGDANGYLKNREQYAPVAEDNTNGIIAGQILPLAVGTYSYTQFQNLGANATLNVKASAGNVYSLYCHNLNAAARFIQIHNTTTVPSGGATPARTYLVPATGTIILDAEYFGQGGINFSTGIAFAFSTTETTYTAGSAADQVTEINYK